jgi:putative transcriptional regulator
MGYRRCSLRLGFSDHRSPIGVMENILPVLRAERGLTQVELAEQVGVSRQTIISIERGRFDPSLALAFRLAEAFDTTVEAIFQRA